MICNNKKWDDVIWVGRLEPELPAFGDILAIKWNMKFLIICGHCCFRFFFFLYNKSFLYLGQCSRCFLKVLFIGTCHSIKEIQCVKIWKSETLKVKLPQAFMQIGWMEDDFRNLTAKFWANLDNLIKRYDFSKVLLILCMSPSQVALF